MNKLQIPNYDDAALLQSVAENDKLDSHPHIEQYKATINSAYATYRLQKGNAHSISQAALPNHVKQFLKRHYTSPPTSLFHIAEMREAHAHANCPMCGSMHSGTLDHVLPKLDHPEFSIFSLNLAPACQCNSKRGTQFKAGPGERVLHPYFDQCLSERLIRATFADLGPVPSVFIDLTIPSNHPNFAAIVFHVQEVVLRTTITGYLRDRWIKLCRRPSSVIRDLRRNPATMSDLIDLLVQERDELDVCHEGKNNWNSAFINGLLTPPVLTWLFSRLHQPARAPNGPLV